MTAAAGTAFSPLEALEAIGALDEALELPAVHRALLATPGLLPRCAAALVVLEDVIANAELVTLGATTEQRQASVSPPVRPWKTKTRRSA